jgi:hypothetical protein
MAAALPAARDADSGRRLAGRPIYVLLGEFMAFIAMGSHLKAFGRIRENFKGPLAPTLSQEREHSLENRSDIDPASAIPVPDRLVVRQRPFAV